MWLTLGIWACALAAGACAGFCALLLIQNRRITRAIEVQLDGLGETHRLGFEALAMDIDRLKQRVLDLETDAL